MSVRYICALYFSVSFNSENVHALLGLNGQVSVRARPPKVTRPGVRALYFDVSFSSQHVHAHLGLNSHVSVICENVHALLSINVQVSVRCTLMFRSAPRTFMLS